MQTFDHLLNWKLKKGSHPFPGPDGGTCINEAALVAAGFSYRRINAVWQLPACFSRPVCEYAMWLNDMSSDEERQRLLPYVTRLACADTPEIEKKRAAYIAKHTRSYWYIPSIDKALEVLDEALAIGRQADLLPNDEVQVRFEAARAQAPVVVQTAEVEAPEPIPTSSVFTKVKSWFSMKETA
jgi:hypothetical protein